MTDGAPHYTVIGAGIVGMCCAMHLQRDGNRVTIIDRLAPGEGTSFGNAGLIQVDSCIPLATPGVLRDVPRMLLDPKGPLVIRWRHLLKALPWLVRFTLNARPGRVESTSIALMTLLSRAKDGYAPLLQHSGAGNLFRDTGELFVYGSEESWRAAIAGHELRKRRGVRLESLDAAALHDLEPALAPGIRHGVFSPDCQLVSDPLALTQTLAERFVQDGGTIVRDNVTDVTAGPDGPESVVAETARYPVDRLVIAAGAYSRHWAARFGARVPLDTERGYHLMLPNPGIQLRVPVLVGDRRFAIVPMTKGTRLAGTAELGGLKAPPDYRRAEILLPMAQDIIPGLKGRGAESWMGYRPSMPDSLPVIGRSPASDKVLFAFGHGHLGLTLAGITGSMIAGLAAGREPEIPSALFSAGRFRLGLR